MIRHALDMWPVRRRVAAAALFPLVATCFVLVGRAAGPVPPGTTWYAGVLPAAALGAAVLASYVPAAGRGLDLGCTPCAMLAGLTLVGATTAFHHYGSGIAAPLVAAAVLLFGLTQRLNQPTTCAAPVREPR